MNHTLRTKIASVALALAATLGVLAGASVTSTELAQEPEAEQKSYEMGPGDGTDGPSSNSYRWR